MTIFEQLLRRVSWPSDPQAPPGANDRPPFPKCEGEMVVVRRTLSHLDRRFELQILECEACEHHERRTINIRGELLE